MIREPSGKIGVRIFQAVKRKKSLMMISQGYALSYMSCLNVCAEQSCLLNKREKVSVSNRKLQDYPVNYAHPRAIIARISILEGRELVRAAQSSGESLTRGDAREGGSRRQKGGHRCGESTTRTHEFCRSGGGFHLPVLPKALANISGPRTEPGCG